MSFTPEKSTLENLIQCDNSVKASNAFVEAPPHVKKKGLQFKNQLKIAFCLSLGHLTIGYGIGWSAPVIPKLQNIEESPLGRVISDVEASWVATIFLLTNLAAINVTGSIANLIGRKPSILCASIMMGCGYILIGAATKISMIYVGRILVGFGLGPLSVINITYIGEIASPNIRGAMIAMTGVAHVLGSILVYSVGPFVSYATVGYIGFAICAVYITCAFFIPESPLFRAMKGNIEAAKMTLRFLGRSEDIDTELKAMVNDLESKNRGFVQSWREIFTEKINIRSLYITGTLFFLQFGCGAMTIVFYATNIFRDVHSSVAPHIGTIALGFVELVGILCTPFFIERAGRKILLLISTSVCAISLIALGLFCYLDFLKQGAVAQSLGWLPLLLLTIFLLGYNAGLSIVPVTVLGEVFTPSVRSTGSSFAFTLGLFSCFVTNIAYGYMSSLGSYVTFWILSCVNIFGFIFVAVFVPETKGKSLTEIHEMLGR